MSFTYGFYNSKNHDRQYDATQFSAIFDGLINDGVYEGYGDRFEVLASTGMGVTVGVGRAWFDHTWSLNDSLLPLVLEPTDLLFSRIDTIVIEVDRSSAKRSNTIKIVDGVPAVNPVPYQLVKSDEVNQYPLAYVHIPAGATQITQSMIENAVGTSECPFVNGIVEVMKIDQFVRQWEAQFVSWYEHLRVTLDGDIAGHLAADIDRLDANKSNKELWANVTLSASNWVEDSDGTYYYSLETAYPNSQYDITDVVPGRSTTNVMRSAWILADCGGYEETNKIRCHGTVPIIDIVMKLCIRTKGGVL